MKKMGSGKKKIEIKKIEKDEARMVTFSKRRKGLFKKADDLRSKTGAKVAMVVISQAGKLYTCGDASYINDTFTAYLNSNSNMHESSTRNVDPASISNSDHNIGMIKNGGASTCGGAALDDDLRQSIDFGECAEVDELMVFKEQFMEAKERMGIDHLISQAWQ